MHKPYSLKQDQGFGLIRYMQCTNTYTKSTYASVTRRIVLYVGSF